MRTRQPLADGAARISDCRRRPRPRRPEQARAAPRPRKRRASARYQADPARRARKAEADRGRLCQLGHRIGGRLGDAGRPRCARLADAGRDPARPDAHPVRRRAATRHRRGGYVQGLSNRLGQDYAVFRNQRSSQVVGLMVALRNGTSGRADRRAGRRPAPPGRAAGDGQRGRRWSACQPDERLPSGGNGGAGLRRTGYRDCRCPGNPRQPRAVRSLGPWRVAPWPASSGQPTARPAGSHRRCAEMRRERAPRIAARRPARQHR